LRKNARWEKDRKIESFIEKGLANLFRWGYHLNMNNSKPTTQENRMSTKTPHCENCGQQNPETKDGYTTCCNEPVCDGGESKWESCEGNKNFIAIEACCGHHAGLKFSAMNIRRFSKAI
jgi:hypothetical protein